MRGNNNEKSDQFCWLIDAHKTSRINKSFIGNLLPGLLSDLTFRGLSLNRPISKRNTNFSQCLIQFLYDLLQRTALIAYYKFKVVKDPITFPLSCTDKTTQNTAGVSV